MSKKEDATIYWPKLIRGQLVKRYKRFLADVLLDSGEMVTAHCPNSGSMAACSDPERPVYLSFHDNPKRKLKYTWELIEMPESLVGVNTLIPNRLVSLSVEEKIVPALNHYDTVIREATIGNHTRLDLLLERDNGEKCFVEIKNCSLVINGVAMFPDAVTARGLKHLVEMQKLLKKGYRCVMFYLIQRMDAHSFQPAIHIDPAYGKELAKAVKKGLEVLVYDVNVDLKGIKLNKIIPFVIIDNIK